METLIKRLERSTLVQAAVYVLIGLFILWNPRFFFDIIVYLVAGYFAILETFYRQLLHREKSRLA